MKSKPNTSLYIPDELKLKAQVKALEENTSLTQLIIRLLNTYLK